MRDLSDVYVVTCPGWTARLARDLSCPAIAMTLDDDSRARMASRVKLAAIVMIMFAIVLAAAALTDAGESLSSNDAANGAEVIPLAALTGGYPPCSPRRYHEEVV